MEICIDFFSSSSFISLSCIFLFRIFFFFCDSITSTQCLAGKKATTTDYNKIKITDLRRNDSCEFCFAFSHRRAIWISIKFHRTLWFESCKHSIAALFHSLTVCFILTSRFHLFFTWKIKWALTPVETKWQVARHFGAIYDHNRIRIRKWLPISRF